ncbi:Uncharacterised protein [Mycobacteroides abscessus]|nr:Uncharacterised protein [Mycobacteroides abscessus]
MRHLRGDVVHGDQLDPGIGHAYLVADHERVGDRLRELLKLRRAHDRVRQARADDDLFLRHLGTHVTALGQAVRPDDGQGDIVPDTGRLRGVDEIARGGGEEVHDWSVLERGRIDNVNDHSRSGQRVHQSLTGQHIRSR